NHLKSAGDHVLQQKSIRNSYFPADQREFADQENSYNNSLC
ncbi:hypothetical protein SAMN04488511_12071, partial [Pedobacter suwonensis]